MRLTLRQLHIFRAIALEGSTAAAALSVPLSQSAASAALKELERLLDAPLFDRVGKRLVLNESGRALLPMALAVLDGARSLEAAFASGGRALSAELHPAVTAGAVQRDGTQHAPAAADRQHAGCGHGGARLRHGSGIHRGSVPRRGHHRFALARGRTGDRCRAFAPARKSGKTTQAQRQTIGSRAMAAA